MSFEVLKDYIDNLEKLQGVPGRYIIVTQHGKRVLEHGAGYANDAKTKPFTADTLVNLYSCSKPITCVAALQLLEKGKFLLEDPVAKYMPAFKDMTIRHSLPGGVTEIKKAERPVLIHQLFTMTSGLSYNLASPSILEMQEKSGGLCPTVETINAIANEPLLFEPGTAFRYSLAHDALGALIEVISGMSFGEYLKKNIFEPLGMENTGFAVNDEIYARMADQYKINENTGAVEIMGKENNYRLGSAYESGGAGLVSCANDYIRFATAMSLFGKSPEGAQILSKSTINMMRRTHVEPLKLGGLMMRAFEPQGYHYGLGVRTAVGTANGALPSQGEFGWNGAAGSYTMFDPDEEIAVFYEQHMRNSPNANIQPRIRNMVYTELVK